MRAGKESAKTRCGRVQSAGLTGASSILSSLRGLDGRKPEEEWEDQVLGEAETAKGPW